MDLKQFVSESLKQIIAGVVEAQKHSEDSGAMIQPTDSSSRNNVTSIEFDVAVTATGTQSGEAESSVGGKLSVASFINIGAKTNAIETETLSDSTTSRIKFSIPMTLPSGGKLKKARIL